MKSDEILKNRFIVQFKVQESTSRRKAMIRFLSVLCSIRFSSDLCWTSIAACLAAKVHPPRRFAPPLQGWDSDQERLKVKTQRRVWVVKDRLKRFGCGEKEQDARVPLCENCVLIYSSH